MVKASSHVLLFFSGGEYGWVYGRRFVFVSVRTIKRHHHHPVYAPVVGRKVRERESRERKPCARWHGQLRQLVDLSG
jgi:hypothetical protein